jgi:PAS domain S-box-containing protein
VKSVWPVYCTCLSFRGAASISQVDALGISDLLAYHRYRNARIICFTLFCLDAGVAFFLALTVSPPVGVLGAVAGMALGSALGLLMIARGRVRLGVIVLLTAQLAGQVAVVKVLGDVATVPLFACLPVFIATATLGTRHVAGMSGVALLTIGIETWIAMVCGHGWKTLAGPIISGLVMLAAAAVISVLHVRETERAVAIAEERDRLRKKAVDDARASEERYRLIADNTDDLIALIDEAGNAKYIGPSHQRKLGLNLDAQSPIDLLQLVHADDHAVANAAARRAHETGHATSTVRLRADNGEYLTFENRLSRVMHESRPLIAIIGRDVTERNSLEAELQKAQRMEALGRLASGVAHDFNNLLGVIAGATDMIADGIGPLDPARQDLTIVQQTVTRATDLTRQLLTFSRKQVIAHQPLDVAATLREISGLVRRMLGAGIELQLHIAPDIPPIDVTQSQLEQIVMNVAANARDAMPNGGRFRLEARPRELAAGEVLALGAGTYLELLATDTGTGIEERNLPFLFEPFFTTKPESRGTGLGLATCYGIATQCGGTILVETSLGAGTTLRILLPESDAQTNAQAVSPCVPQVTATGRRVLLVDDDPGIIKLATRMLAAAGYEVTPAETLPQAEQLLSDATRQFDVLLTDIVLGNDRGTVLAKRALETRPNIRVVLMSGYAPDPDTTASLLGKRSAFLPKPFDRQSLLALVDPARSSPRD